MGEVDEYDIWRKERYFIRIHGFWYGF
jgi:hypothetical protein